MASARNNKRVPVVEILSEELETANKRLDYLGNGLSAIKVFAGTNAFRVYEATTGAIKTNAVGTLQGMVKSAKARTVFRVTSELGEKLEIVALLAGLAENLTKAGPEFEAVLTSKDSPALKAIRLQRLAEAVAARTAVGVVTSGVETIYDALKGWCMIGGLAGGRFGSAANKCVDVLEDANLLVKSTGAKLADYSAEANPTLNVFELVVSRRSEKKP